MLASVGSMVLAMACALLLGVLLGRLATQWSGGRGLNNLLVEVRGGLLPFVVVPILSENLAWPSWVIIGTVVGGSQAAAVARWIGRRTGEWSPTLVGGIALGRSGAALVTRRAAARGAVSATIASTVLHVLALEGLLAAMNQPQVRGVGAWMVRRPGASVVPVVALAGVALLVGELAARWTLQRRRRDR